MNVLLVSVIKMDITVIHLNLSIIIGIAQVLFVAEGSEKLVENKVSESTQTNWCSSIIISKCVSY